MAILLASGKREVKKINFSTKNSSSKNFSLRRLLGLILLEQYDGSDLIDNFHPAAAHIVEKSVDDGILIIVERSF